MWSEVISIECWWKLHVKMKNIINPPNHPIKKTHFRNFLCIRIFGGIHLHHRKSQFGMEIMHKNMTTNIIQIRLLTPVH